MSIARTNLAIGAELTIYHAAELRVTLAESLARGGDLVIDLACVTEMDSAGVQLLMSAKKTAAAAGRSVQLVGHSPAVLNVYAALDLATHFGDPLEPPAAAR